mmetsp:Transcript_101580/g.256023  ORF Transcript_101580/g.256023 Transcript_101580/m.256023 type:complete len:602 (+) Transcript_101580:79-1884(+)
MTRASSRAYLNMSGSWEPRHQQNKRIPPNDKNSMDKWLDSLINERGNQNPVDKAFFHSLIHSCAKAGNARAASACTERMLATGIQPTTVTINSVIDACAKAGNLSLATRWWDWTIKQGLEPNGITYNTMINACAQARDATKAEWWIQKMVDDGRSPCIVSFSTVIDAFAKTGSLSKAEAWFQRMQDFGVGVDAVIYNSLINACAKAGKPCKAEHYLQKMSGAGLKPDEKSYNGVINACAKGGAVERAESWFHHMQANSCKIDTITFGSVMHASARVGNVERVEHWIEEMQRHGLRPNLVCFNTILHACAHGGAYKKALLWFERMVEARIEPNKLSYNNMINASAKAGDFASAEQWLQAMAERNIHPDRITYMTLMREYQPVAGRGQACNDAAQRAYGAIVKAYVNLGNTKQVKHWLAEMAHAGVPLSSECLERCLQVASGDMRAVLAEQCSALPHRSGSGGGPKSHENGGRQQHATDESSLAATIKQLPLAMRPGLSPVSTAPSTPPPMPQDYSTRDLATPPGLELWGAGEVCMPARPPVLAHPAPNAAVWAPTAQDHFLPYAPAFATPIERSAIMHPGSPSWYGQDSLTTDSVTCIRFSV